MRLKGKNIILEGIRDYKISLQLLYVNNTVEPLLRAISLQWPLMKKSRMVAISGDLTVFDSVVSDKIQVLAKMPQKQHNDKNVF